MTYTIELMESLHLVREASNNLAKKDSTKTPEQLSAEIETMKDLLNDAQSQINQCASENTLL